MPIFSSVTCSVNKEASELVLFLMGEKKFIVLATGG